MAIRVRRPRLVLIALAAAMLGVLAPAGAPPVLAAGELRFSADTTYRIDTNDRVVRVRIDVSLANNKPNLVRRTASEILTTRYYWNRLFLGIQTDARSIRVTSGGTTLRTSVKVEEGYRRLTATYPNLYYRQNRKIRVEYDLPSGKARSASEIRVGAAFATFTAWGWGDPGRSTVRIIMPNGFINSGYGESLSVTKEEDRTVLASGVIADPNQWYAVVIADRPSALTDVRIGPPAEPIVVRAWPEDRAWRDQVVSVLGDGVPVLKELIGLDWPVPNEMTVTEVYSPLLEGYAGVYESGTDEVRISEEIDPLIILHEASHAWFDRDMIDKRWITEGLAQAFAARVHESLGLEGDARTIPAVERTAAGAFPLDDWPQLERIETDELRARERYGYDASWMVMDRIVEATGEDGMRKVFQAMADGTIGYVGDGRAEPSKMVLGWGRFLDLVEEIGDADGIDDLFETWVIQPYHLPLLEERAAARTAYDRFEERAGAWAVPYRIRADMWAWKFDDATTVLDAATDVIERRDALAAVSDKLGASAPNDLETPFEAATSVAAIEIAGALISDRIEVAEELIATRLSLAVERSPLANLGLLGEVPGQGLEDGLAAFTAGDLETARTGAATTAALLAGAESIGGTRALAIGLSAVGVLVLLLLVAWLLRRRRRRGDAAGPSSTLPRTSDLADVPTQIVAAPNPRDAGAEPD